MITGVLLAALIILRYNGPDDFLCLGQEGFSDQFLGVEREYPTAVQEMMQLAKNCFNLEPDRRPTLQVPWIDD